MDDVRGVVRFVGLGSQGGPIAMRILQGGFPLSVWARRPEATVEYVEAGAVAAADLAELGRSCTMIGVCVLADADVLDVVVGPAGLLIWMRPGSSLAIHSTAHPETVRAVSRAAADVGVTVLDAPVSGGNAGARAGTMAVLLGGDPDVAARWRPVIETFATTIELLGQVGAGQLAKLVNNALASVTIGASSWALGAGEELGLDREALTRAIAGSSGNSFMLRPAAGLTAETAGFAAARLRKDLTLLDDLVAGAHPHGRALAASADACVAHLEEMATRMTGA